MTGVILKKNDNTINDIGIQYVMFKKRPGRIKG
jgi:hypothetical protein